VIAPAPSSIQGASSSAFFLLHPRRSPLIRLMTGRQDSLFVLKRHSVPLATK